MKIRRQSKKYSEEPGVCAVHSNGCSERLQFPFTTVDSTIRLQHTKERRNMFSVEASTIMDSWGLGALHAYIVT